MKKNNVKKMVVAASLVAALGLVGVSAYFTDNDAKTNAFTVGKVTHELREPSWDPETAKNITPGTVLAKDPTVFNNGINDQFVFLTVEVPYADDLVVHNADGTKKPAADTQLFDYTVNEGWTQLGQKVDNADTKTYTYTYYYGADDSLTVLAKDTATPTLFDNVQFVNAIEGQQLEESSKNIEVKSYGIQTDNLNGASTPSAVWNILKNHNGLK